MKTSVFAGRSVMIALAAGLVVAVTFGGLIGAQWYLAATNGLAAGTLALGFAFGVRNGRFRRRTPIGKAPPWAGAFMVALAVAMIPSGVIYVLELDSADRFALQSVILLVAFASYVMGFVAATLHHAERPDGNATDGGALPGPAPPPAAGHRSTNG